MENIWWKSMKKTYLIWLRLNFESTLNLIKYYHLLLKIYINILFQFTFQLFLFWCFKLKIIIFIIYISIWYNNNHLVEFPQGKNIMKYLLPEYTILTSKQLLINLHIIQISFTHSLYMCLRLSLNTNRYLKKTELKPIETQQSTQFRAMFSSKIKNMYLRFVL